MSGWWRWFGRGGDGKRGSGQHGAQPSAGRVAWWEVDWALSGSWSACRGAQGGVSDGPVVLPGVTRGHRDGHPADGDAHQGADFKQLDGCTAAMPRGRRRSATARRRAGRGGWTRRSWPSARRASRPAPSRRRTASRAGVGPICAAGRRPAAVSATKSAAWASSGARSASPGSRPARRIPGPTPSGKPSAKKRPELIAAAVGAKGRGKRLEIWFQDG